MGDRELNSASDQGHQPLKASRIKPLRKRGPAPQASATADPMQSFGGITVGEHIGKLAVLRRVENQRQHARWECLCECGQTVVVRGDHLRDGKTTSCGCAQRQYQEARTATAAESITLKTFGKVLVMGTVDEFDGIRQLHAVCICHYCGGGNVRPSSDVLRKNFRGCDCRFIETLEERNRKFGFPSPVLVRKRESPKVAMMRAQWRSMIARCHDPNNRDYPKYGRRGIVVCSSWRQSFKAFLEDNGVRPLELTLHRIDNDGPYSPENCKWSTREEQTRNRRITILVEYQGSRVTLAELATLLGISYTSAYRRHRASATGDQIAAWVRSQQKARYAEA